MTRRLLDRFPALDIQSRVNAFELAAIVYDDSVSIDHLMCFFADELANTGHAIGGFVRQPPEEEDNGRLSLTDLMTGDSFPYRDSHIPRQRVATLEDTVLEEVRYRYRCVTVVDADLVFVPRFGLAEVAGHGLSDCFSQIAACRLPILTAVHRDQVNDWLKFTGGIGTLLACRLRVLRDWWRETDQRRKAIEARQSREPAPQRSAEILPFQPG